MPDVHFIGDLTHVANDDYNEVSVTFALVPGSSAWFLKEGIGYGETHSIKSSQKDCLILNYPLDAHYEITSSEGWPFLVCELWDRSTIGARSFIGCGGVWLPQSGTHSIDICLWQPTSMGLEKLSGMLLPTCPDLRALRDLIVSPYLRSEIEADSVGLVKATISVVTLGFETHGVQMK